MFETTIPVSDPASLLSVFGARDQHLRTIRDALGVAISARDGEIRIQGEQAGVTKATNVLEQITTQVQQTGSVAPEEVQRLLAQVGVVTAGAATGRESSGGVEPLAAEPVEPRQTGRRQIRLATPGGVEVMNAGRSIQPRSEGQARYIEAIRDHEIVICVGPAGTGKTYLAVALAVNSLKQELIRKIVLVRPAVEAGESLGFLPGDLHAKINPYLRPLLDALREMMDYDQMKRYMERDLIEVIPLAYMRGRSLNDAFIILDEAQNTTVAQMKMFLTRMGHGSRIVVSGDATQIDLPEGTRSGLIDAMARLGNIRGICQVSLSTSDIVRNPLVHKIVQAYEEGADKRP